MADPFAPQPFTLAPQMFSPAGGVDSQNPLLDLLRALGVLEGQRNQGNLDAVRQQGANQQADAQVRRATSQDALFGQDLGGMYGTPIDRMTGKETGNPFDNGFFKTNTQRNDIIADRQTGMPNVESLNYNPFFQAAEAQRLAPPPVSIDAPLPFTQILNQPITDPRLDGGASAEERTRRALASRRPQFSIF